MPFVPLLIRETTLYGVIASYSSQICIIHSLSIISSHHSICCMFKLCNNEWFDVWFMIADDNSLMNKERELDVVELLVVLGVDTPSYFFLGCQVKQVLCQRMVFICI